VRFGGGARSRLLWGHPGHRRSGLAGHRLRCDHLALRRCCQRCCQTEPRPSRHEGTFIRCMRLAMGDSYSKTGGGATGTIRPATSPRMPPSGFVRENRVQQVGGRPSRVVLNSKGVAHELDRSPASIVCRRRCFHGCFQDGWRQPQRPVPGQVGLGRGVATRGPRHGHKPGRTAMRIRTCLLTDMKSPSSTCAVIQMIARLDEVFLGP